MSKVKLLTILVIVLFLINAITLSFFILKRPHDRPQHKKMPREIVINKLHFDTDQVAKYDLLIKTHGDSISKLDNDLNTFKNKLYRELSQNNPIAKNNELFIEIAKTQAKIEKLHFNHFLAIKKLCKTEQLEDFNILADELSKIFSPLPRPKDIRRAH